MLNALIGKSRARSSCQRARGEACDPIHSRVDDVETSVEVRGRKTVRIFEMRARWPGPQAEQGRGRRDRQVGETPKLRWLHGDEEIACAQPDRRCARGAVGGEIDFARGGARERNGIRAVAGS